MGIGNYDDDDDDDEKDDNNNGEAIGRFMFFRLAIVPLSVGHTYLIMVLMCRVFEKRSHDMATLLHTKVMH